MKTKLEAILEILGQIPAGPARERLKEATHAERYAAKPKRTPEQIALDTYSVLAFTGVAIQHPKVRGAMIALQFVSLTQEEKEIKFRDAALEVFPSPMSLLDFMTDKGITPDSKAMYGLKLLLEERDQEVQLKREIEEMYSWVVDFSGAMGKIDALGKGGEAVVTKEQASKMGTPEKGTPPAPVEVKNYGQAPSQDRTLSLFAQDLALANLVRKKFANREQESDVITITHKEFNDATKGE